MSFHDMALIGLLRAHPRGTGAQLLAAHR